MPVGPATVCFDTRPVDDTLVITGVLDLAARNPIERVLWRTLLRLPERVGAIRYVARERDEADETHVSIDSTTTNNESTKRKDEAAPLKTPQTTPCAPPEAPLCSQCPL